MHNKTTFPCLLWCMDACSVYNITIRKCRVVLTQCGQPSKASQISHDYLCFALNFLLPGKKETQFADWKCYIHQKHPQTMQRGQGAVDPRPFESAVGWGGVEGRCRDQRNVSETIRPSQRQSRRTGGSGVSARCRRTPYCHLVRVA